MRRRLGDAHGRTNFGRPGLIPGFGFHPGERIRFPQGPGPGPLALDLSGPGLGGDPRESGPWGTFRGPGLGKGANGPGGLGPEFRGLFSEGAPGRTRGNPPGNGFGFRPGPRVWFGRPPFFGPPKGGWFGLDSLNPLENGGGHRVYCSGTPAFRGGNPGPPFFPGALYNGFRRGKFWGGGRRAFVVAGANPGGKPFSETPGNPRPIFLGEFYTGEGEGGPLSYPFGDFVLGPPFAPGVLGGTPKEGRNGIGPFPFGFGV